MRLRPIRLAACLLCLLALTACGTGGAELQRRIGHRLERLQGRLSLDTFTTRVAADMRKMSRRTEDLVAADRRRFGKLTQRSAQLLEGFGHSLAESNQLASRALFFWDRETARWSKLKKRGRFLVSADSARRLRHGFDQIPEVLRLNRYILPGRKDPNRSMDPYAVQRQETWLERILQRF